MWIALTLALFFVFALFFRYVSPPNIKELPILSNINWSYKGFLRFLVFATICSFIFGLSVVLLPFKNPSFAPSSEAKSLSDNIQKSKPEEDSNNSETSKTTNLSDSINKTSASEYSDSQSSLTSNKVEPLDSSSASSIDNTSNSPKYFDGIYQGSSSGFRGGLTVEVQIQGGEIVRMDVIDQVDDTQWFQKAYREISQAVLINQTANIDAIAGATYSSTGIIEGLKNALSKASQK